jgi:hypothetical protein
MFCGRLRGTLSWFRLLSLSLLLSLLVLLCSPVQARSLRKATQLWEQATVHQAALAYISLGTLNDMVRGRRLSRAKAQGHLRMLIAQLDRELRALKTLKVYGSGKAKAFVRHLRVVFDFLLQAARAFDAYLRSPSQATMRAFLTLRNAAARDVGKTFRHPGRKRVRSYRGGWRVARFQLSNSVAREVALGYLTIGLLGDAYFKRLLSQSQLLGFLNTALQSLSESSRLSARVTRQHRGKDRRILFRLFKARAELVQQGASLKAFVTSRKRSYLRKYSLHRRRAWAYLAFLGR